VSALAQALEAAQAKAVAALAKDYVRGDGVPSDEDYFAELARIGLDDVPDCRALLAAWYILRERGEKPPAEQAPRSNGSEQATDAQWKLIRKLADEKGTVAPEGPLTKANAHAIIDQLKAGIYKPDEWVIPF
jgi:hypothetical protein